MTAFTDLKPNQFPVVIEFFAEVEPTRLLHTIKVDGPGVTSIPGQDFFKERVVVKIALADGTSWDGRDGD